MVQNAASGAEAAILYAMDYNALRQPNFESFCGFGFVNILPRCCDLASNSNLFLLTRMEQIGFACCVASTQETLKGPALLAPLLESPFIALSSTITTSALCSSENDHSLENNTQKLLACASIV